MKLNSEIRIPIIKVKDRFSGHIRFVGEDQHDVLMVNDGHIDYLNLQCCCGTQFDEDCGYEFVGEYDDFADETLIEFVPLKKFIKMAKAVEKKRREDIKRIKLLRKKIKQGLLKDFKRKKAIKQTKIKGIEQ